MTKLKQVIEDRGIKQRHIAKRSGLHETLISMISTGRVVPTLREKRKIANALKVPIRKVFK